MNRSHVWGRLLPAALLAFALTSTPLQARADSEQADSAEGWGNVWGYSLCAAGVALGAVSGSFNVFIASMIYCRQLYREAV